ncbi:oxidoreductase [Patescibacteria group bacterium]|nr:oxidoreductase [Patescibacteria group bacterium]
MRIPLVDRFLDGITMYRLMLYGLSLIAFAAIVFGFLGVLSYSGLALLVSLGVLFVSAYASNFILAKLYGVTTNAESSAITALILFFLFMPATSAKEFAVLVLAAVIAMASKYVLAYRGRHLFNPVAVAAVVFGFSATSAAIWWVATPTLLPYTLLFGFLVVRKIERFALVGSFTALALIGVGVMGVQAGMTAMQIVQLAFVSWPIIFFSTVMLTEPITTPPRQKLQAAYGAIVGVIFSSQLHIGPFFATPELALIIGNIFSYAVSSKERLTLVFKEKRRLANDIYEFVFTPNRKMAFKPGQYAEWTLAHNPSDTRGNRRYFTIASSPTEHEMLLGVRLLAEGGSSFKKSLYEMKKGDTLYAGQFAGDFTLPADPIKKLVFIAGGIGVTPFRSMLAYLRDTKQKRDIVMLYSCKTPEDVAYEKFFRDISEVVGLQLVCTVTDAGTSGTWTGEQGMIDAGFVKRAIPDFTERHFFISGPPMMVKGIDTSLRAMGVTRNKITTDFFPGFGG